MRRLRFDFSIIDVWQYVILALAGSAIVAGLLIYRLGGITPGFSAPELNQRAASSSVQKIIDNPLFLVQKSAQFGLQKLDRRGPAAMRLPAAIIGFVAVVCIFIIFKNWHTTRMALLGTLLFATSSWFLHTARLATTDINFVLPLLLILGGLWLRQQKFMVFSIAIVLLSTTLLLYIPAMIFFLLPAAIWQRRNLSKALSSIKPWWQTVMIMLAVLGLAPLIWAFIRQPDLMLAWLGLPSQWPLSVVEYLKSIAKVPLHIFIKGSGDPVFGIGRLPLLDVFTSVMVILGAYAYVFKLKLDRTKIIISTVVIGTLLIALNSPLNISFLMPYVYMLATGGITLLVQQWFTVFPRNPVAKMSAFVIVSIVTLLAVYYHINHYFIAWPKVPATKATFSHNP